MKRPVRTAVGIATAAVLVLSLTAGALAHGTSHRRAAITVPAFQTSDLTATPMDDWITQEGNLAGNRYSGLTDISAANVTGLKQSWHVKLTSTVSEPPSGLGGEAPQVEYQGTLFAEDAAGRVYARDAATGAAVWLYEPHNAAAPIPAADKAGD